MEIDISEQVTQHHRKKGLKKVISVLKEGEGGSDTFGIVQAVGSNPESPTGALSPGNVGADKMPKIKKPKKLKKLGREQGPGINTNNGSIVEEASQPPPRLKTYKKPVQGKVKKMGIKNVVDMIKGGAGSGRKPSGVKQEHHDALTKAGFKHVGSTGKMQRYEHPSEASAHVGGKNSKGVSVFDANGKGHGYDMQDSKDISAAAASAVKVPIKVDTRD